MHCAFSTSEKKCLNGLPVEKKSRSKSRTHEDDSDSNESNRAAMSAIDRVWLSLEESVLRGTVRTCKTASLQFSSCSSGV